MQTHDDTRTRALRALVVPLLSGTALLACATVGNNASDDSTLLPPPSIASSVSGIADQLVESAKLRTDVRSLRVCVHSIAEAGTQAETTAWNGGVQVNPNRDAIGHELTREFSLTLSDRMNIVETGFAGEPAQPTELLEFAKEMGATHIFVGDYVRRRMELIVSVKLIDVESLLILAAARGRVPVSLLSDLAAAQMREKNDVALVAAVPRVAGDGAHSNVVRGTDTPSALPDRIPLAVDSPAPDPSVAITLPLPERGTEVVEDFATWRARRLAERAARGETLTAEATEPRSETFQSWRERRMRELLEAEQGGSALRLQPAPLDPAPEEAEPAPPGPGRGWLKATGRNLPQRPAKEAAQPGGGDGAE